MKKWFDGKYIKMRCPDHPNADKRGELREHVYIAYEKYGEIPIGHVVHHINGNCLDNRPENLELVERIKHLSDHGKERYKDHKKRMINCRECGKNREYAANDLCKRCYKHLWYKKKKNKDARRYKA